MLPSPNAQLTLRICCSFCGKDQFMVEHIITGPCVNICNECVELCVLIIADKKTQDNKETNEVPR